MKNERDAAAIAAGLSLKKAAIGAAAGIVVTFLSALALSALISAGAIDPSFAALCAAAAVFLGGVAAGFLSSGKRRILISAAITALLMTVGLAVLGIILFSGGFSAKMFLLVLIISLVSCIIGSVIAGLFK